MAVDTSRKITTDYLRTKIHADLVETADSEGPEAVESFLENALGSVRSFLIEHGKHIAEPPGVIFDPDISGVEYDPYHRRGERLLFGGPRGILRGGYQYLSHRDYLSSPCLLTILSKGLLHAYNQQLVFEYFDSHGSRPGDEVSVQLYDDHMMLAAGADEGFTQMFSLYIEGDITDKSLREGYIKEWASWYERRGGFDADLFGAVAYTISNRVEAASGDARDRMVDGLAIQEPLVGNGALSVLHKELSAVDGSSEA